MSETKKALGRKSRSIGKENRGSIYLLLTKESLTFSELLNKSGFSRSTLSNHLKDLIKDDRIQKEIKDDQVVYKANLEKDKIVAELKLGFTSSLYDLFFSIFPGTKEQFDSSMEELAEDILKYGREEALKIEPRKPQRITHISRNFDDTKEVNDIHFFTTDQIEEIAKKYPEAIKELLEKKQE